MYLGLTQVCKCVCCQGQVHEQSLTDGSSLQSGPQHSSSLFCHTVSGNQLFSYFEIFQLMSFECVLHCMSESKLQNFSLNHSVEWRIA